MGNRGSRRVAVVGSAFRFPSTDAGSFWDDLLKGRDLVSSVAPGRWSQGAFLHPDKASRGSAYTFAAGSLGNVSGFDAGFFGISPREAAQMDPQQRLLLELAWEAFEDAGIAPAALRGSDCGVYIGIANVDYSMRLSGDLAAVDSAVATGTTSSIAANRLSYFFDLRGPSMAIDTACSSALVAFHQACRAIASGEIGSALVGGMSLHLHPYGFVIFSKASMLSRRGRCRAFDADGDGYVRSEGGGIFLLKDYDTAVADGDRILAVVAHTHSNTDGYKAGLTVPRAGAQVDLLERAYREAGIAPADIDYIEAHGTGTVVGDPIEAQALGQALGRKRPAGKPLPIGSIKSNLGHLEAAAGVAGVVKAIHALRHRCIPATMGIRKLRPDIPFAELNLEVVTENRALPATGTLTIGVNSFGFGGANAHVILQNAPDMAPAPPATVTTPTGAVPLLISAASANGLKAVAAEWAEHLKTQPAHALHDIAYHAIHRREWLPHRAVVWGRTPRLVAESLQAYAQSADDKPPPAVHVGTSGSDTNAPAFVYSGNGSQWVGMGRALLKHPVFRAAVRQVDARFRRHADFSLEAELSGRNGSHRYERTEIAQPALFALQVGITEMLRHLGVRPSGITGHSVGEVAAAWASGALTLDDAVSVIFHRSRLQGGTKGRGQMTAVAQDPETVEQWLKESGQVGLVCVAGYNSPRGVTLAGPADHLADFEATLRARGITHKRLDLDYAFHSDAMDAIASDVIDALPGLHPKVASTPFYSTVSGMRESGETLDGVYWWRNVRQPVQFETAIARMAMDGIRTFIEIGPHPVLRGYLRDIARAHDLAPQVITTLSREHDDVQAILNASSAVMVSGAACDWKRHFPVVGGHVDLPRYPWQREVHWHVRTSESEGLLDRHAAHPLLGSALAQQPLTWENRIDPALQPLLADHVVDAGVVFPGTAYIELALAAAREWKPQQAMGIESLEILAPLNLPADKLRVLRVSLDPADGRLQMRSREHTGDGEWTLHATARLIEESGHATPPSRTPAATRAPDFIEAAHTALTRSVGLDYGPAFRAIDVGWVDGGSVRARFKLPEALIGDVDDYLLHPALLDCAFQLIIQMKDADAPVDHQRLFVPTGIGRVMHLQPGRPHSAHARLLRRSPHSMLADFTLYDEFGAPIAHIDQVRFRALRTQKARAHTVHHLVHELTPCPLPGTETAALPHAVARAGLAEAAQRIVAAGMHDRYTQEIEPLLDALCSRYLFEALHGLGELPTRAAHKTRYVDHLLARAESDGLLVREETSWRRAEATEVAIDAPQIWHTLVHDYPDHAQIAHAVGRIGLRLAQLIAEPDRPLPDMAAAAPLAQRIVDAEAHRQIGQALHELVLETLGELPGGQRLRVMEIHGGAPLFAADLCSALDFNRADCSVIGLDNALDENSSLRSRHPALITGAIPGDEALAAPGTQQLVVMSLAFDSAEQAERALTYALRSLAPQGLLVLLGHQPARWMDFVHGANPAWWPVDGSAPQRNAAGWKARLVQSGLEAAESLPLCADPHSGAFVLLGRQPARAEPAAAARPAASRHWIILADRDGDSGVFARRLADQLAEARQRATLLEQPDEETLAATLRSDLQRHGQIDGVIHLAGMNGVGDAVDAQVYRCGLVTSLMRSCESLGLSAPIWMLTHAAMNGLLAGANPSLSPDAALWGFARSLINEVPGSAIRLIDLESLTPGDSLLQALMRELDRPDAEDEVVLGGDGARYAMRMQPRAEPITTSCAAGAVQRLVLEAPGQLRNLRWETHTLPPPGPGEIEVEVHATGLNFRDVMYALGLLPDEAIEGGFAGPTLGLEFAGTVRRVGADVVGHAPGDAVMGFGPASFSTRVITRPDAIAAVPLGLSCEAAATIPSAFFTAYYALHHQARLCEGESVLIHGAAGGVGLAAIQIARWCGAQIFVTAGAQEKRDFLQLLGVQHILDSRSLSFADDVMTITGGRGIDVVLNSIAGEAAHRSLGVLKPFGRFIELGKRDFYENTRMGLRPFRNNITYFGVDADQLMKERPTLTKQLYAEVMALFAEGVLHALPYQAFEADDCVDAFRFMQQAKQIGKVVVTYRHSVHAVATPPAAKPPVLALDANATYLVSGGLSGFGLRTAQWLVRQGARHLVLLGRRGLATDEARTVVAELEQQDIEVFACACDVTQAAPLADLMREIASTMPPLKGVVHAAAVIHDGLVRNLDDSQIRAVLEPKMRGAWNLHLATRDLALDHFVLYSSATAMFGNPGQSSYVGANLWLDALARHRRAMGLPATAVLWGAIDDVGFLARNEELKDAMQDRMGGHALPADTALQMLATLLQGDRSGEAVLEVEWRAIKRFLASAEAPKFERLAALASERDGSDEQAFDVPQMLRVLPDAELLSAFIGILGQQLGEVLRVPADRIDPQRALGEMGLDSLMGLELIMALESRFGVRLPAMALSEYPTVTRLAERLMALLRKGEPGGDEDSGLSSQIKQVVDQHVTEMSAEQKATLSTQIRDDLDRQTRRIIHG
jgi:acyl transferase domain-containing protein/NADPH:quinone reductase-like Zn-dependent oxidoreductase/NAD(P)-dependent dehydrogenase (short-subunit alcohol dehydrogenase family)/acyl carrier protein